MKRIGLLFLMAMARLLVGSAAMAQTEGVYTIPRIEFESGATMENLKVGFVTYGKLNADKTNAVLLLPATSSGRRWAEGQIGPGKAYDTDKYFLIGTDAIGNGTSSQPKDGLGSKFPAYTIRDLVRAEYEMVTKGLDLTSLRAVVGPSMGSFQAVEWGINYPDLMRGLVLIVPAARSDQHFHAIADAFRATITLDPNYKEGAYDTNPTEGIRRAGTIYFPWLLSDAYLQTLKEGDYEKQLWAFGNAWAQTWDANAILLRYNASRNHDASKPFGGDMKAALSRIRAKTILIVSETDRTVPNRLSQEIKEGVKQAEWVLVPSMRGHLGTGAPSPGSPEDAFMTPKISAFLDGL